MPEFESSLRDFSIMVIGVALYWMNYDVVLPVIVSLFLHFVWTLSSVVFGTIVANSILAGRIVIPFTSYVRVVRRRNTGGGGGGAGEDQAMRHLPEELLFGAAEHLDHNHEPPGRQNNNNNNNRNHRQHPPPPAAAGPPLLRRRMAFGGWLVFVELEEDMMSVFSAAISRYVLLTVVVGIAPIYGVVLCIPVSIALAMLASATDHLELVLRPQGVGLHFKLRILLLLVVTALFASAGAHDMFEASLVAASSNPFVVSPAREHPLMKRWSGDFLLSLQSFKKDGASRSSNHLVADEKPVFWDLGIGARRFPKTVYVVSSWRKMLQQWQEKTRNINTSRANNDKEQEHGASHSYLEMRTSTGVMSHDALRSTSWASGFFSGVTDRHVQTACALLTIELFTLAARAWTHLVVIFITLLRHGGGEPGELGELPVPGDTIFYAQRCCVRSCEMLMALAVAAHALSFQLQSFLVSVATLGLTFAEWTPTWLLIPLCMVRVVITNIIFMLTLSPFDSRGVISFFWPYGQCSATLAAFAASWKAQLHAFASQALDQKKAQQQKWASTHGHPPEHMDSGSRVPWFWQAVLLFAFYRWANAAARWHEWTMMLDRFPVLTKEVLKTELRRRRGRGGAGNQQRQQQQQNQQEGHEAQRDAQQLEENRRRRQSEESQLFERAVSEARQRSVSTSVQPDDTVCVICLTPIDIASGAGRILRCGHYFHQACLSRHIAFTDPIDVARCCMCRRYVFESQSPPRPAPAPAPPQQQPELPGQPAAAGAAAMMMYRSRSRSPDAVAP